MSPLQHAALQGCTPQAVHEEVREEQEFVACLETKTMDVYRAALETKATDAYHDGLNELQAAAVRDLRSS